MELLVPDKKFVISRSIRNLTLLIMAVLVVQLVYGAFMAGHKAATAAPTWPDINGYLFPPGMMGNEHGLLNLVDNKITIHFIHRGLAYILLGLVLFLTLKLYKTPGSSLYNKTRWWPLLLVFIQVVLGIFSVLTSIKIIPNQWGVFEWMAQLHQFVAMLLLLSLVWILFIVRNKAAY